MFTFLVVLTVVVFLKLLIVSGIRPPRTPLGSFELERRNRAGDSQAQATLRREQLIPDVISLQRVISALLLVVVVLLSVTTFDWLFGTLIAVVVALEYGAIARLAIIQRWSSQLYGRLEPHLLTFISAHPNIFKLLRSVPRETQDISRGIDSREDLQHLVSQSGTILSPDEKKLIVNSLSFNEQLVSTIMTPRSVIDSIKKSEFLGPLTLDELHKTGHSRLPVIDGDIDHVVGILHLQSLLALDIKRSVTAEKAMEPRVFYIREDQTLQHALAAFLRTHHHLFVVVNEFRETVGLLALEDVIEALLGRKIIDEFDAHDDLRTVALRNPRSNNHPEKRQDV
ncbi:CBS domain-containing protein [Candidatus Saccharibacteria bacterium]|nr:CBS domain-containing protein [Candidatus Saccharibacteria bacterium]